ncbi:LuxR C-terminal-related transcriptional regulator [Parapedobacter sp.]
MSNFLPDYFNCSDTVRQTIEQKLAAFAMISSELPVYIVHDVRDLSVVYMSSSGLRMLGSTLEDVRRLGLDYFTKFFNPDDVAFYLPKFKERLQAEDRMGWFSFFQQVATGHDRAFEWYLSASRPFVYDETGVPLLSLTFALQLDPNHHLAEKAKRLMAENLMLKDNYQYFASLTKREKELLQYIASGERTSEISSRICVSEKTLNTHRRNIKRKIGAKNHYDIIKFAQAFNLV